MKEKFLKKHSPAKFSKFLCNSSPLLAQLSLKDQNLLSCLETFCYCSLINILVYFKILYKTYFSFNLAKQFSK